MLCKPDQTASEPLAAGQIRPLPLRLALDGSRQDAVDGKQRTVKSEFAQGDIIGQFFLRDDAHAGQQAESDGQVKMRTFLEQISRRKIERYAFGRQA